LPHLRRHLPEDLPAEARVMLERLRMRYRDYRLRRVYAAVPELEEASREPLAEHLVEVMRPRLISHHATLTLCTAAGLFVASLAFPSSPWTSFIANGLVIGFAAGLSALPFSKFVKHVTRLVDLAVAGEDSTHVMPVDSGRLAHLVVMGSLLQPMARTGLLFYGMFTLISVGGLRGSPILPNPIQMSLVVLTVIVAFELVYTLAPATFSVMAAASALEEEGDHYRKLTMADGLPVKMKDTSGWLVIMFAWAINWAIILLICQLNTAEYINSLGLLILLLACSSLTLLFTERAGRIIARQKYQRACDHFRRVCDIYRELPPDMRIKPGPMANQERLLRRLSNRKRA
jgi:hypothetical protein